MSTSLAQRRRERTRQDILDAAWAVAGDDGLAALALRDIAAAVGMRAPSLYTYFDGKDAILDAMFADGWRQLSEHMDGVDVHTLAPADALAAIATAMAEFCLASLPRYQLMFTPALPGWEPSPEAYAVSVQFLDDAVASLADIGITDPGDVDLWVAITSGLIAQQAANDPTGDRWLRLVPRAAAMFLTESRSQP